jgi:hypothetical protein
MTSLANPSAASRTILGQMTSRYGDVFPRSGCSSSRSVFLNSMTYGLRRSIGTSRLRVCQTERDLQNRSSSLRT